MVLAISNTSQETISASLLIYDPNCQPTGGQPWRKLAWWNCDPGHIVLPDALYVDLTTVNGWAGIYAYGVAGGDWQGTGNAWFEVTDGLWFNQCGEDEISCVRWVDYWGIWFNGQPTTIVYIGPDSGQIRSTQPAIYVTPGEGSFYISGRGFAPGSSVNVIYNYIYDSNVTTNAGDPSVPNVDSSGNFATIVDVSTLLYSGRLDVQATDNNWHFLNATISVDF